VKDLLQSLGHKAPEFLLERGINPQDYQMLLRAAVESIRGTASATTSDKRGFVETVLEYGKSRGAFVSWNFEGTENRQDYRVELASGTLAAIEVKGCPDGNNMTIWDRPGWAEEFVVWSLCPESLQHNPGHGIWSGIATRLMPKLAVERTVVDAVVFWDGRCGSELRRCPKQFGIGDGLRARATDIRGQDGRDWLPPPCVYLMPQAPPLTRNNPKPRVHAVRTCKTAATLLSLFGVPDSDLDRYAHEAAVEARGGLRGTEIKVTLRSRCWPDGEEREISSRWKAIRRE
jgi:hypothetical protein